MTTGCIKTRVADRGVAFITPDEGVPRVVVVQSSGLRAPLTLADLTIGQTVEFEVDQDAAGRHRAVDVRFY